MATSKNKKAPKKNQGAQFEQMINITNQIYLDKNVAVIYKKPTPIQVVKVDYPNRSHARIKEAFYKIPSTTDYNGIYRGKYIDFEAKSINGTSFPFSNLHKHQIEHLIKVYEHGAIAFLIVLFNDYNEIYLLDVVDLSKLYIASLNDGRKSIPYSYFKEHAYLVPQNNPEVVDYIKIIEKVYFGEL